MKTFMFRFVYIVPGRFYALAHRKEHEASLIPDELQKMTYPLHDPKQEAGCAFSSKCNQTVSVAPGITTRSRA